MIARGMVAGGACGQRDGTRLPVVGFVCKTCRLRAAALLLLACLLAIAASRASVSDPVGRCESVDVAGPVETCG